jgi:curved DNA-binding protein CbpA
MDIQEAYYIFGINAETIYKIDIKKQYYKLALKYHPDKHQNSSEATAYFQKIQEAYHLLKRDIENDNYDEYDYDYDSTNMKTNNGSSAEHSMNYFDLLNIFFKDHNIISSFLSFIQFETLTMKLFDNIDKQDALDLYNYFFQYRDILHISEKWLDSLKKIIIEKYNNIRIYILEPSLTELFSDRIYKLDVDGNIYYVPLWYSELVFENDLEIIVKCVPKLPNNISIDENNNILVDIIVKMSDSLFKEEYITISDIPSTISDPIIRIPVSQLFIRRRQQYILKGKGIIRINETNIYSEEKSDIILNIQIT